MFSRFSFTTKAEIAHLYFVMESCAELASSLNGLKSINQTGKYVAFKNTKPTESEPVKLEACCTLLPPLPK